MKSLSSSKLKKNVKTDETDDVEKHFLKTKDLRVYTDYDGKLHRISELTDKLILEKKIELPKEFKSDIKKNNKTSLRDKKKHQIPRTTEGPKQKTTEKGIYNSCNNFLGKCEIL